jgi:hypothetical protein
MRCFLCVNDKKPFVLTRRKYSLRDGKIAKEGFKEVQLSLFCLSFSGATGFYHSDWVVVQKNGKSEVNWIFETKDRVWEGTKAKDNAITGLV